MDDSCVNEGLVIYHRTTHQLVTEEQQEPDEENSLIKEKLAHLKSIRCNHDPPATRRSRRSNRNVSRLYLTSFRKDKDPTLVLTN